MPNKKNLVEMRRIPYNSHNTAQEAQLEFIVSSTLTKRYKEDLPTKQIDVIVLRRTYVLETLTYENNRICRIDMNV